MLSANLHTLTFLPFWHLLQETYTTRDALCTLELYSAKM